ncbi:hypothetical protein QYF36_025091 [Acer negundo]|nr:hypothetical protein QYF36_025091 [Acer negundo]
MLVLIPQAKLSSWRVNAKIERAVVVVNLVEDKAPVCFKWLKEFLGMVLEDPMRDLNLLLDKEIVDLYPRPMVGAVLGERVMEGDKGRRQCMGDIMSDIVANEQMEIGECSFKLNGYNGRVLGHCVGKGSECFDKCVDSLLDVLGRKDNVKRENLGISDDHSFDITEKDNLKLRKASGG